MAWFSIYCAAQTSDIAYQELEEHSIKSAMKKVKPHSTGKEITTLNGRQKKSMKRREKGECEVNVSWKGSDWLRGRYKGKARQKDGKLRPTQQGKNCKAKWQIHTHKKEYRRENGKVKLTLTRTGGWGWKIERERRRKNDVNSFSKLALIEKQMKREQ